MADIAPELYEKIKESFDRKYAQAQLFGGPMSEMVVKINNGTATFQDANIYASMVGGFMADAMKENLILDELPGKRLYSNIARKTIGEGLKDTYGIVSAAAKVAQAEHNAAAKIGLKPVQPKLETKRVDNIVNKAAAAKTQQELNAMLETAVPTFARQVVDDTQKANARQHNKAGLAVKVEREYDGVGLHDGTDVCDWCLQRAGTWTYDKAMANGVFERHEGCGCIITYTSAKGEKTISVSKYDGWMEEKDQRIKYAKEEIVKKTKLYKERRKERLTKEQAIIAAKKAPINQWNFTTYNNSNTDSIRPRSIRKELQKSAIGKEIWEYLQRNNTEVQLLYGFDNPENLYGSYDPYDDVIRVYCDKTLTILETTKTVIHETVHKMNQDKGLSDFEYEFKSFEAEVIHECGVLTKEVENNIIRMLEEEYGLSRE